MMQGSILMGYYDFDIYSTTTVNGVQTNIWGWVPSAVSDNKRITRITDRTVTDPHIGISAIPSGHSSSVRLATSEYEMMMENGYVVQSQTAAGGRIGYQFTVDNTNAIAQLDYAAMLEYPQSHSIIVDGNGWKYYQPWVQIFISVVDGGGNDNVQEPTRIMHAYQAPAGQSGWQQPSIAGGWQQLSNVPLYSGGVLQRNMILLKKDWSTAGFDLRSAIGQTVRIWCEYYDCAISAKTDDYTDPEICWDHHMARLYSSLVCTQAVLQKEGETCDPATVTYSAPEGFTYRWYTTSNPGMIVSTDRICTYTFNNGNEQTDLVCEIKSPSNMKATTLSVPIENKCACHSTFSFPEFVCADAQNIEVAYEYTSGSAKSYDVTFSDEALMHGFNNLTNQTIQYANRIFIPMPAANGTQYVRPDQYLMTLRVHQSSGVDTVMTQVIEVRYPSWLIQQRWDDVLALYNQNYNGGYYFSAIQWYQAGMPIASSVASPTYVYQPGGLNTEADYWAALTRMDDGKTFCTCAKRPVPYNASSAPEKKPSIDLSAVQNDRQRVHVTADMSGKYIVYSAAGQALQNGWFGDKYSTTEILLPAKGSFVLRFFGEDGTEQTMKWIAY